MNNRQFNVNGSTKEMLGEALKLAFAQRGETTRARAFSVSKEKGLVLYWSHQEGAVKLVTESTAETILPTVWAWLQSEEANQVQCVGWDADYDHDGDNEKGWRVYCEDWGHVGDSFGAIIAIKPAYLWYGK